MISTHFFHFIRMAGAVAIAGTSASALATEGGGGIYPNGAENYMVGAVPPPGTYVLVYGSRYEANTLRDNSGNRIPVDFHVRATALAPRLVWVTDTRIGGGQLAFHAIAPIVDLSVSVAGNRDSRTGLGDITFGPALAYHASPNFHYVFGLDVNAPTGSYRKGELANIGRNYWNLEGVAAMTYVQPAGINADVKLMYDFNARNKDTDYRSGQEFHADFALGWGMGNGWTVGAGGYVYRQTTSDSQAGTTVSGNRGRAMALGPSVKFDGGKWLVTAKYEKEISVRNRAEGGGFAFKAVLPF